MDCSLLEDEDYIKEVTAKIPIWLTEGPNELTDNRSIWDWIKYNIRVDTIRHSKQKAMKRKAKETNLQREFEKAKQIFDSDPDDINANALNSTKEKLEPLYEKKIQGIIIRARARWWKHGEKSTKYFFNLEKRNHVKKHVRKLKISGSIITDPFNILSEEKHFYQKLHSTSKNNNADNLRATELFLSNLNIRRLTKQQMLSCEGKITLEACGKVLESFQNNKAPGNDGIPVEFYKNFWPLISENFINCVNECFEKGEMSCSQKQAVITLIEKKGKDRSFLENWRLVSLVNVDAKIVSKVLAVRIKNVLPYIIHHNQSGYVKDRYIGETVRSIFDLMVTLKENIPGLMIFIDFHKAFESIEWIYLVSCLKAFQFGPDFIRWVKTLYKNIQSCVINNDLTTDCFALARGVRQGDPLSPYLFVVVVETLAMAIRQNSAIKGITISKEETKLLQYADDTIDR